LGPGGLLLVGLLLEWKWQLDVQNQLATDQGEMFPARLLCEWWGEMYPAGCRDALGGGGGDSRKRTMGGWALGLGSAVTAVVWAIVERLEGQN
jgi:hypothetical protein